MWCRTTLEGMIMAKKNSVCVSRADGDRVIVALWPEEGNADKRVEVHLYVHDTGVVTVDVDANDGANIDVDVFDYTPLVIRDGNVTEDRSVQKAVGVVAADLRKLVGSIPTEEVGKFDHLIRQLEGIAGV